ncbi:DUF5694 domain-containing protein [Exiguobacterium acetylicum]|uniref:DUF5694 domain-containing protein n=1 Tax=Exiguobacterium sp. BMC-KP TaxID=1684312 RepID=UPI0006AA22B2|nr:DUF5694 domain-containing protein [Exiguobacterium sp. BMC-KP]KOP29402.1 hypothetical protein ADM98_11015 [Exiguobacterium sp. BMC-KP]
MKPQVLLIGLFHLDRPANGDMIRPTIFDVTSKRRQREIKEVVTRLNTFRPTCVALETAPERMDDVQHTYETYQHESDLTNNERQQIGFRLARMAGLAHLHGVDWNESVKGVPDLGEISALHPEEFETIVATETKRTHQLQQAMEQLSFSDWLDLLHAEQTITASATVYEEIERLKSGRIWIERYWHVRNQKIVTRLLKLAQTTERIVCLYGAAHLPLLRQYLNESNQVEVMTWNDWNNRKECM